MIGLILGIGAILAVWVIIVSVILLRVACEVDSEKA